MLFFIFAVPRLQDIVGCYGTLIQIEKKNVTVTVLIPHVEIKVTLQFFKLLFFLLLLIII